MPNSIGNAFMKAVITSPLHSLLGDSFAVIAVKGVKSGNLYTTPINVIRERDALMVVSKRERTWWRNLRGDRVAQLSVSGKQYPVRAEVIERAEDVAAALSDYSRQHPDRAKYLGLALDANHQLDQAKLEQAANERVVIRLRPV